MILINTKTNEAFSNVSKVEASNKVGVSRSTIYRWIENGKTEHYNHWLLYFDETKLKQNKGKCTFFDGK